MRHNFLKFHAVGRVALLLVLQDPFPIIINNKYQSLKIIQSFSIKCICSTAKYNTELNLKELKQFSTTFSLVSPSLMSFHAQAESNDYSEFLGLFYGT